MKPLWEPDEARVACSQMTGFQKFVETAFGQAFQNYDDFHAWSVLHTDKFWGSVWQFCGVKSSSPYKQVTAHLDQFPGTSWFPGSTLNFAENLLRYKDDQLALVGLLENGHRKTLTYRQLWNEVERLASAMRRHGIKVGDTIAGFLPNVPEAVVAMLATTSLGAVWSSCSPDFGATGAVDRFGQIKPRLLFATRTYVYGGKQVDCTAKINSIANAVDSIEAVILIPAPGGSPERGNPDASIAALSLEDFSAGEVEPLRFTPLPFTHPVYVLYSSGTTGAPKCILHSAGGTLIQHLKELKLHTDVTRKDTLFYFTTCGWMMWNWLVSGLATGCTLVLYDGSPFANKGTVLLDAIDNERISIFGTSAKYIAALEKQDIKPRLTHKLSSVKTILSTGSPLSAASFEFIYRDFKEDVCLSSISGGTDIVSCFMLGNPNLPVYSGEIQCRGLGMAVEFWDVNQQHQVRRAGELVCTKPFPSMPVGFWHDPDQSRYLAAYFSQHPGVWTHGDLGELTAHGGVVVQGRSDAVLNPAGVRIGTAEIYRQVETLPQVVDCVAVGQDWQGDERIVLFVVLRGDLLLDEHLVNTIKTTIRRNTTPRHVPAKVLQVADIPRTISGKIVELAVKTVIHGGTVESTDALANPDALALFRDREELTE